MDSVHTSWCGDMLVFCPDAIARRDKNEVLIEARRVIQGKPYGRILLCIDCTDLTQDLALQLWRTASFRQIRDGFRVFERLPYRVEHVVVCAPREAIPFWTTIVRTCLRRMSKKMQARVQLITNPVT